VGEDLSSTDQGVREAAVERLCAKVPRATAEHLLSIYRETAQREAELTTMTDILRVRVLSTDPYVRAVALHLLGELGAVDHNTLDRLAHDEHEVVREVASALQEKLGDQAGEPRKKVRLTTIEKIFALGAAPIFSQLTLEGLSELAQASVDAEYAPGYTLCEEGEIGDEVFIVLAGEVTFSKGRGAEEKVLDTERVGSLFGEMAVLDPAPRSATARAGTNGVHVLRLSGEAFREVLNANPAIATRIIRTLAQRLRGPEHDHRAVAAP
jgi:hypothetical protein